MKKLIYQSIVIAFVLSGISCGGNSNEMKEEKPKNTVEAITQIGEQMKKGSSDANTKMKERKAKGDTLAMNYKELQKYLPLSIDGYKTGEPNGTSINMQGMSYSSAEATFKKDNGDHIKVTIIDYNAAYGIYTAATAMWAIGMNVETPEEKVSGIKMDNEIGGWETFKKKRKDATVTLGVGYRFWVNIEANNQESTDFIKSVAKSMRLDDLAKL